MKKFVTLFLLLTLMFTVLSVPAFADSIDLSKLSDAELTALFSDIKAEMFSRGISVPTEITLREGKFIVGEDILPGTYTITCIQTEGDALGSMYSSFGGFYNTLDDSDGLGDLMSSLGGMMGDILPATIEILGDYGTVLRSFELKAGDSTTITLTEKTALQISDGSCTLKGN